jgi:hypothetical protein
MLEMRIGKMAKVVIMSRAVVPKDLRRCFVKRENKPSETIQNHKSHTSRDLAPETATNQVFMTFHNKLNVIKQYHRSPNL